jgi:hypothetical protein
MLLDAWNELQAFFWTFEEQLCQEVSQVFAPIFVVLGLCLHDHVVELSSILGVEGRKAVDELEEQGSQAPPIDCSSVSLLPNNFWREVLGGSADGEGFVVAEDVAAGEAEICEFDVAVLADEDVFRFQAE